MVVVSDRLRRARDGEKPGGEECSTCNMYIQPQIHVQVVDVYMYMYVHVYTCIS